MELVAVALIFAAWGVSASASLAGDLWTGVRGLFSESLEDAADRVESAYALIDLMMLAILADDTISEEELRLLKETLIRSGHRPSEMEIEWDELVARIAFKSKQLNTPHAMRVAVRGIASQLDSPKLRALAFGLVHLLHHNGSRLGPKRGGYRENFLGSDGLLQLFGEALHIDPDGYVLPPALASMRLASMLAEIGSTQAR